MKRFTSPVWGTQETAIAFVRGGAGSIYRHKTLPIVGVISAPRANGRVSYAIWKGNAAKPAAYYSASSFEQAQRNLAYVWGQAEASLKAKAERQAEKAAKRQALKASDHFTVGDVLVNSWGYEQTNVDFYQVTGVDAKSVRIRPIGRKAADTAYMSGICQPDRYNYTGPEVRKPLSPEGRVSFRHGGASKWDGKPVHYSYYH